jgi:hypothetical protein
MRLNAGTLQLTPIRLAHIMTAEVELIFEFASLILRNAAACPAIPTLFAVSPGQSA